MVWEFKNLLIEFLLIKRIILLLWSRKLILQEMQVNGNINFMKNILHNNNHAVIPYYGTHEEKGQDIDIKRNKYDR